MVTSNYPLHNYQHDMHVFSVFVVSILDIFTGL